MKNLVVYRDADANLGILSDRKVAILGYGKQGRSQALNLRDSGVQVLIASIRDESAERAEKDGFEVVPIEGCAKRAQVLLMLVPDGVQKDIYDRYLKQDIGRGHTLVFSHGYNYHFGAIQPAEEVDVVLVAPRMIGVAVRTAYVEGNGVPAYVSVGQDGSGKAKEIMLAVAKGIGCTKAGAIEVSFEHETVVDLFGEQALGPIFTRTVIWAVELLEKAGIHPEVALIEAYGSGELAEVFHAASVDGFWGQLIKYHSETAQYGELSRERTILPEQARRNMEEILEHIRNGGFAREWDEEQRSGNLKYESLMDDARNHPINEVERHIARNISGMFSSTI